MFKKMYTMFAVVSQPCGSLGAHYILILMETPVAMDCIGSKGLRAGRSDRLIEAQGANNYREASVLGHSLCVPEPQT